MPRRKRVWNLKTKIVQALRRVWFYSPERAAVVKRCKVSKNKYKCEGCGEITEKIQVDHIVPVVNPNDGFKDWNTYISQLFVSETQQQGLCKVCHTAKTLVEQNLRKK